MNAVGIDVSKGKSMVAIMRPFGEIVSTPFEIKHTTSDINSLVELINSVEGESRIVMLPTSFPDRKRRKPPFYDSRLSLHNLFFYSSVSNSNLCKISLTIPASSIRLIPKHFLPASFKDAPT